MKLHDRCKPFASYIQAARRAGMYPYFRPISRSCGPEVEVGSKRLVMVASNDYLGLSSDRRVKEKAAESLRRWGTGPGGSRFLCGNMTLHETLEGRLAEFLGKKGVLVHTTGFGANLGAIGCLLEPGDVILYDKENHASIYTGCRSSGARIVPFEHNDAADAARKLARAREKHPRSCIFLITEGVFSMSGDLAALPELAVLKENDPELFLYVDDAHGLGVFGRNGRGTADCFGMTQRVDFIMGTFSKALASIGGFIASDDLDVLEYLRHSSKTLIFSAALPAVNVATVLACLDILAEEPERIDRLHENARRARDGYREIGLDVGKGETPIVPVRIGEEEKAYRFAVELFENGIFAVPAVYPAVPRGNAIIRTAFMSTHEQHHLDRVLEVMDRLAGKYAVRIDDLYDAAGSCEADVPAAEGFS
ncbi:MAG: pyridoxal phosphate-dependent aminotransferase family protein [Syntrophobacteraceae bacterium]|nr:pyridoxal phosphate-dependent aminotransferase family protein [Desulfobacteraceae bacterium]